MGEQFIVVSQNQAQRNRFVECLLRDIRALELMYEKGMIESGKTRIGAEQELCFIDNAWRPTPIVMEVLKDINDPHFTTELAQFNMEINLDPMQLKENAFSSLEKELRTLLNKLEKLLAGSGNHFILTGILPTIRGTDLDLENITPIDRYIALDKVLTKMRGGEFEFRINGTDELITRHHSVMFESCNTSWQVHYQVSPEDFINKYNWAQAIAGPVLASATNSPLLLGKKLWAETRIALFQQSVDIRQTSDMLREISPRVYFGNRWLKGSPIEIFKEDIVRHKVLICPKVEENSLKLLENGELPDLKALSIHNGTIYKWNRACYGKTNGVPHFRIENRILPAGPTVLDEIANTAFWVGLMHGMPDEMREIEHNMEFDDAKGNFLKAARQGLYSQFRWIDGKKITAQELILKELMPIAFDGLSKASIRKGDIIKYLEIVQARVESGKTGSQWILDSFENLKRKGSRDEALVATTAAMVKRQKTTKPVHTWDEARLEEAGSFLNYYWRVDQIMSTDLFAVNENDNAKLVTKIMDWRNVRHVPVENAKGEVTGLITSGLLVHHLMESSGRKKFAIKDIMITNPVLVNPETLTIDALALMKKKKVGCLLVVKGKRLVGIVTEHDFVDIANQLFNELVEKKK